MAHELGGLAFPFAAPSSDQALTDPALDIFAAYFNAVLLAHAATAWNTTFPGEPLVRRLFKHDPEEADFVDNDLPALYLWREHGTGDRSLDGNFGKRSTLNVLWVAPPQRQQDRVARSSAFLNGFSASIVRAVEQQRDPAWIHASETAADFAIAYGSSVRKHAGFSHWELQRVERQALVIPVRDGTNQRYSALLAEISLWELSQTDVSQYLTTGLATPPQVDFSLNTGGATPLTTQHEIEPDPP